MMNCVNIDNTGHVLYGSFKELYAVSFPVFEQRTRAQQEKAFASANYRLTGYEEEGTFIGFISWWEFDEYLYIEHFAVRQQLRGQGYGSRILQEFIRSTGKLVLLEIDPVVDAVSAARLSFYRKCGFYENPYPHIHPPYRHEYRGHALVILTTRREITEREYQVFSKDLREIVMKD